MRKQRHLLTRALAAAALAASITAAVADGPDNDNDFCMDVDLGPFHMVPGFATPEGACAVRDYWDGWLQEKYYPFTIEDHLFNCQGEGDTINDVMELPVSGDFVPTSVAGEGEIIGTINGHSSSGTLLCASLTNWYAHFCPDPPAPCFQLAQPFLKQEVPYHTRVTEVSVFDGVITVEKGKNKPVEVPIVMATHAAGITHLENLDPLATQVGASVTHSLLGLLTYEDDEGEIEDVKELDGSLDVLLQGHIFFPGSVEEDEGAAVIKGTICSKKLYRLLNRQGKNWDDDDDRDDRDDRDDND